MTENDEGLESVRARGFEIVARAMADAGNSELIERVRLRRASPAVARVTGLFRLSRDALTLWVLDHARANGLIREGYLRVDPTLRPLFACELVPLDAVGFLLDVLLE